MLKQSERSISLPLSMEQAIIDLHESKEFSDLSYSEIVSRLIELGLAEAYRE